VNPREDTLAACKSFVPFGSQPVEHASGGLDRVGVQPLARIESLESINERCRARRERAELQPAAMIRAIGEIRLEIRSIESLDHERRRLVSVDRNEPPKRTLPGAVGCVDILRDLRANDT
jgi:hypothetical protein